MTAPTPILSIKAMVFDAVASVGPDKWPTYDGKMLDRGKFVTSSEVGKCERMIWFAKRAASQDASPATGGAADWGFFARGHNVEAWIVKQLRAAINEDYSLQYLGEDQVSFHIGQQSGTPDGVALHKNGIDNLVLEFKSIDPRTNIKNLPKKEHVSQVQQNIDLVSHCLDIPVVGGSIAYFNCSDYTKVYEYYIPADYSEQERLEQRAKKIAKATKPGELVPEGMYNKGCVYCPFKDSCSDAVKADNQAKEQQKMQQRIANNAFTSKR